MVDPVLIEAIRAWKRFPGRRGALTRSLLACVQATFPGFVTTFDLADQLEAELGLCFECSASRREWIHNSLVTRLRVLVRQGAVRRLHELNRGAQAPGVWKWVPPRAAGLAALAAQAVSEGVRVEVCPDEPASDSML
jgi:hypothetical protein